MLFIISWKKRSAVTISVESANSPYDVQPIRFSEFPALRNSIEKFSTGCKFEAEIIFFTRFEPFVEFYLCKYTVLKTLFPTKLGETLTMLGWLSPRKTSISPHTASSLPFTFLFEITFRATSFRTPLNSGFFSAAKVFSSSSEAEDPWLAMSSWLVGTFHVARFWSWRY